MLTGAMQVGPEAALSTRYGRLLWKHCTRLSEGIHDDHTCHHGLWSRFEAKGVVSVIGLGRATAHWVVEAYLQPMYIIRLS